MDHQILTAVLCGAATVIETSPLSAELVATLRARSATVLAAVAVVAPAALRGDRRRIAAFASRPPKRRSHCRRNSPPIRAVFPNANCSPIRSDRTFRGTFCRLLNGPASESMVTQFRCPSLVLLDDGTPAPTARSGAGSYGSTIAAGYWNDLTLPAEHSVRTQTLPARLEASAPFSPETLSGVMRGLFTSFAPRPMIKTRDFASGRTRCRRNAATGETPGCRHQRAGSGRGERIVAYVS